MSLFARWSRPLAKLDGPVNWINDLGIRAAPWAYWPASPPWRDRPYGAGQHAALLAWTGAGYVAGEVLTKRLPEESRPSGRQLRAERILTVLLTAVSWIVAVGAWDRRAERLRRRPWQRRLR